MSFIKKILKSKKGETMMFTMLFLVMFVFLTIFLVDIGMGYVGRVQMQNINDACAIAGAKAGAYAYISRTVDKKPHAIVIPGLAVQETKRALSLNKKYLLPCYSIDSIQINPSGENVDGRIMNTEEQYYSGNYTVKMSGRYKTIFTGKLNLFGLELNVPFLNYRTEARVHVHPELVDE